jgi:HPt (histidine-containing phosphotransfer) domain-containing protein
MSWQPPLSGLHAQWEADLTRFRVTIQDASVPQKSRDMVLALLDRMAQLISKLEARLQAS